MMTSTIAFEKPWQSECQPGSIAILDGSGGKWTNSVEKVDLKIEAYVLYYLYNGKHLLVVECSFPVADIEIAVALMTPRT